MRAAFAALQAGRFAQARDLAATLHGAPAAALLHALGRAGAGDVTGGAAALEAVARANPAARHPVHDLVDLLRRHGHPTALHLQAALALRPQDAALAGALGADHAATGDIDQAIAAFHQAVLRGGAPAWSNLGKALAAAARFEEAEAAFAKAVALAPDDAQLALNRAVALLRSGRLAQGWEPFRVRHRLPGRPPPPPGPELRQLHQAAGRRVLLLHDEGFGDTLQFIRYAPLLVAAGARIAVQAPPPLARLLAANGFPPPERLPPERLPPEPLPPDLWCRIPDLPGLFATTLETIPATLPYLHANPAHAAAWARRLPPGRRIGLAWAGAPRLHDPAASATDRQRSIPAAALGPLVATPGITWISLQKDHPAPPGVFDPMPGVQDFADTAAIMASLESVVSVDTAVAHLAAAMGRPVLLLDRFDPCWRWLHGRDDSPWYPGVLRLVRQHTPGDWPGVLHRAAALLAP